MKNIIRLTNDFILANGIHTLPLGIEELAQMCSSLGYKLISYSEGQEIIKALDAEDLAKYGAFTHRSQKANIVFFNEQLSTGLRNFVIAHEIGHIVLKHNYTGNIGYSKANTRQEQEANTFAFQLLAPLCILHTLSIKSVREIQSETLLDKDLARVVKKRLNTYSDEPRSEEMKIAYGIRLVKRKKSFAPLIIPVLITCALATFSGYQRATISKLQSIVADMPPQTTSASTGEFNTTLPAEPTTVYVSQFGTKYHKENCYHIKNSTAKQLTLSDAETEGYSPCKDCY